MRLGADHHLVVVADQSAVEDLLPMDGHVAKVEGDIRSRTGAVGTGQQRPHVEAINGGHS